ncbi:MAG: hypothetical protein RLZZ367_724 [Bacteroidota bacterium]|jgi:AraC-like DNA-binding protein
MKKTTEIDFDNLVVLCLFEKYRKHEELVSEHLLGIQISGETQIQNYEKTVSFKEGTFMLLRKNQLMRAVKIPNKNGEYKSVLVFLNESVLRKYALEHKFYEQKRYTGETIKALKPDPFLKGYFTSILPYVGSSIKQTDSLFNIKTYEAIELLLKQNPKLKALLFDFSKPYKTDLEKFMVQNFKFNVPLTQFAALTGRSVAAFKRDFKTTFNQSPRQWLQDKRLDEAYRLIKNKKQNPPDIYLELGFENLTHFYRVFKKKFGLTPAELKNKAKQ